MARSRNKYGRSVIDYPSESSVKHALHRALSFEEGECSSSTSSGSDIRESLGCGMDLDGSRSSNLPLDLQLDTNHLDWFIPDVDPESSRRQTIEEEAQRLMALKSYMVLEEVEKEQHKFQLDRLARLANRLFGTQMAFASVMDLGRALFLGRDNLSINGVARKGTFCAHALVAKNEFFEVRDSLKDPRFADHPYVQAGVVMYYAAQVLVTPEGQRLGTFAIVGNHPRKDGLTPEQKTCLKDLADTVMEELTRYKHAKQLEKTLQEAKNKLATLSHDLMTPLTGVQLSLSLLQGDTALHQQVLLEHQKECIATAASCAAVMGDICESLRTETPSHEKNPSSTTTIGPVIIALPKFVQRLHGIMEAIPKRVPLIITVAPKVPERIIADELKLFRACLNLLTLCSDRANDGAVHMTIRIKESIRYGRELLVEVEDSGPELDSFEEEQLFEGSKQPDAMVDDALISNEMQTDNHTPPEAGKSNNWTTLSLFSLATQIKALGGDFGVISLRSDLPDSEQVVLVPTTRFWFSLSLNVPSKAQIAKDVRAKEDRTTAREIAALPSMNGRLALVVDDSIVVRKALGNALSRLGFQVQQAANGMDGLRKMQETMYDIVFLDYLMPVMDGLDCIRVYRNWEDSHRPHARQHIVGMSAHANPKDIERGLALGMNCYRSKPLTLEDIEHIAANMPSKRMPDLDIVEDQEEDKKMSAKRQKVAQVTGDEACLVATDLFNLKRIKDAVGSFGWTVVAVDECSEAQRLLQARNWGAVIIDCGFSDFANLECVREFRKWEQQHRVHRQNNIYLLHTSSLSSVSNTLVDLPFGIDGILQKPALECDIKSLVSRAVEQSVFQAGDIVIR